MDRIYKYNSDASYKPNGGIYLQLITTKDFYIQNITVAEHNSGHSDSFQVKFPNVFTNYLLGAVRVEDQRFKDWDHYKFTIWQSQLNFVVVCASSACGVSVEHLNAKEPMIRSIYRFHVYYHIRRILKILEISLPYENSFNQYNNPYNHEKFIGICSEYGVSNDLTKCISQHGKVELGKQVSLACHTLMKTHSQDGLLRNQMVSHAYTVSVSVPSSTDS